MLLDIFYNEGDEVPVLTNVAVIGAAGEKTESFRPSGQVQNEKPAPLTSVTGRTDNVEPEKIYLNDPGCKMKISPRARILAEEKGIDICSVTGTGPEGRIIVKDIEEASTRQPVTGDRQPVTGHRLPETGYTDQPLSNVRKLISKAMHDSLQNSAQLTHHMSADVSRLLDARRKIKDMTANGALSHDITINDMVCRCVILALKKIPGMNIHLLNDGIRTFTNVHLGLAVDTPRGLMVPVVRNADAMDIYQLSREMKSVAEACRKGNIDPELLRSSAASFTVSNLGNYGVEMFTPVINLPQAGILGVCAIINRPADLGNKVFGFVPVMGLSLTYDHRAIDGGPATLFLKEIKEQIEKFEF
jgi:pyruvate dehydrogenase E2 component (dihydrolipoamide acetyltransferase)